MALQALLDTLDDVLEALQSEYKQVTVKGKDGKDKPVFALDIAGVQEHPNVLNLKTAFERVKADKATLTQRVAELENKTKDLPDDFDPEEFKRLKDRIAELEASDDDDDDEKKKKADGRKLLEQKIAALEKKNTDTVAAKDKEIADRDRHIERLLVDDGLGKALDDVGVSKKFKKAATAMLRSNVKVVRENDQYKAIVETDMGPEPLAKYVADWADSDEGKEYVDKVKGADADGSGSHSKVAVNPFDEKTHNLSEQGRILRSDRAQAERLMKSAKWPQDKINKRLNAA